MKKKTSNYPADCCAQYAKDVEKNEVEGLDRSDAQGAADVEHAKLHTKNDPAKPAPATHTPGPWTHARDWTDLTLDTSVKYRGIGNGRVHIARAVITGCLSEEESLANARLISAAPELKSALEGMMEWARRVKGINPGPEILNAMNAIAKAEGK